MNLHVTQNFFTVRLAICSLLWVKLVLGDYHAEASPLELAKVGDLTINSDQFKDALKSLGQQGEMILANPDLKKRFLDHMINSRLVATEAKKSNFEKDSRYQARLQDMADQLLAGEFMDRNLEKQMSEKAIENFYKENKKDFSKKEVNASHILVDNEDDAKKALREVNAKVSDFDLIAKKYSKDKTVNLGFFPRGQMVPEFDNAAFSTPKGKVHPNPVKTSFGWHIIKINDVRGDDNVDFKAVKESVRQKMRTKLQEEFMKSLREKTKVTINEEVLKKI
ncbi:MAG: peptidyl-prolyl cis-trans isomerase [Proteobacteria bacterium]|nr:peptidyl-prolyl cis-trans isomerase [Pseudomonadota bacterium]